MQSVGTPSTIISGTPIEAGTWDATITAFDVNNSMATRTYTFEVRAPGEPLSILPVSFPNAFLGEQYSRTLSGSGGSASGYRWSIIAGAIPGLSITPLGTPETIFSGVPATAGTYVFTVELRDSLQNVVTEMYTIHVVERLVIPRALLPVADLGAIFSATVTASGGSGAGYTWAVVEGRLPNGVLLAGNGLTASLSGVLSHAGAFFFTLQISDHLGDVVTRDFEVRVSARQRYAVWAGDTQVDQDFAVYAAELGAAAPAPAPLRISPPNPGSAEVQLGARYLKLSPDGRKMGFLGDFATNNSYQLYSVDLSGASPAAAQLVNSSLAVTRDVTEFAWSPDGARLLYQADQDLDEVYELYAVDMSGATPGAPVKINGAMQATGDVEPGVFSFSPNSAYALYLADQQLDGQYELYLVDLSGTALGPATRVNSSFPLPAIDVHPNSYFSTDSTRVFYLADQLGTGAIELWMVELGSTPLPAPVRINGLLPAGGNVLTSYPWTVALSPDGAFIAYLADQDTNNVYELYLVDLRASPPAAPIKLNSGLVFGGSVEYFLFSPDGSRVIYVADQDTDDMHELYYVDISGAAPSAAVKINPPFHSGGDIYFPEGLRFSPDGTLFGYMADAAVENWPEVFVLDVSGLVPGAPANVVPRSTGAVADSFRFSPNSARIAVDCEQLWVSEVSELGVPSTALAVTPAVGPGMFVDGFLWTRDSSRLLVYGDLRADDVFELYWTDAAGGAMTPLHPQPPLGGDARTLVVPPN